MSDNLYIQDDNDMDWFFNGERIICKGDKSKNGGYSCNSLAEGLKILEEYGYLTTTSKLLQVEWKLSGTTLSYVAWLELKLDDDVPNCMKTWHRIDI